MNNFYINIDIFHLCKNDYYIILYLYIYIYQINRNIQK